MDPRAPDTAANHTNAPRAVTGPASGAAATAAATRVPARAPITSAVQAPASITPTRPVSAAPADPVRVSSTQLFAGAHEVLIEHRGALYRLKQTSLGKLILTK